MSESKTMKAAILHKNGDISSPEVMSLDDVPIPEPAKGELLIKVHAAAINPVDWKLATGEVPGKKQGPLGFDVAGVIEKIGPDTTTNDLSVGDAVYADAAATQGSFAEYVLVKTIAASPKPPSINFEEAASLPLAGLTAIQGLRTHGLFQEGHKVLIFGGSGGVGSLAVQMAKAMGASEVYSTGSDVDFIKKLGADEVINYKEQSLMDALKGKDFDVVYDTIGGLEHWQVAQASLKKGGRFVTLVGDGGSLLPNLGKVVLRALKGKIGLGVSYSLFLTDTNSDAVVKDMIDMTEMVTGGKLKPILDERRFEFTQGGVVELFKASMSHRAKGKLVLQVIKD